MKQARSNLKNQQQKKLYFFLAPVEALCWRPNYRANTLYHLNFLYISSSITLLAIRISLLQFFYLGSVHWSSSPRQHPAGCPHSVVWCCGFAYIPFLFKQAPNLEFAPTSNLRPPRISAHANPLLLYLLLTNVTISDIELGGSAREFTYWLELQWDWN